MVVGDIFPLVARQHQENYLNYGRFLDSSERPADHPPFLETHRSAYTFKERINITSLHTKTFTKSVGGHGPRGPPGYATAFKRV